MSRRHRAAVAAAAAVLGGWATLAHAQVTSELTSQTEFRVCADPHDLPFSDSNRAGYENKIAELIAKDWKLPVAYTWFPDSQGFIRATLQKFKCDVVMGTVVGVGDMATTSSYYHTGYMLVSRSADHIAANEVGDPAIGGKRFGLVGGTPPTDLLVANHLMDQTSLYNLVVDTRLEQPSHTMLQDLAAKKIDVALLWGPFVGYYISNDKLPLTAAFLHTRTGQRQDYHIAMGVRSTDTDYRRRLNTSIARLMPQITAILRQYSVPLLDEQGNALAADAANPG